jgi:hypothetical protein
MRWELRALGATGMEGRLWTRAAAHWRGRAGPAEPGDPERAQDRREIEALLGDAPAALAVAPYAWLGPQGWGNDTSVVREVTAAVLATNVEENALAFVCLCGTNYGGRILGFRVPTLLAGVKLEEPGRAAAAVSAGLDRLNARYRFGLIASRLAETNRPLIVADGVIPSPYKRLSPEERPAFAVWGRWLVLSSNVEALTTLLERNRPEAAAGVDRLGGAHTGAGEAAVWMDLEATDDALAKLAAVCRLAAYAGEGTGGLGAAGRRLGIARGWVRALSSMRRLQAEMRLDGRELEVSFRLGEDAGGAPAVRESVAP